MMDGKHYKALIEDTLASDYDLVVMGALGMGAVKDSQLGSVTERFVRRVTRDTLVVRNHDALKDAQGAIVVGLDGSPQSFHGLKLGIALGKALNRPVQAVAVYDPYLHYAMFNGIVGVLNEKASKIFRFKEQEQLHEEIIDTGLAKIYQSHLEIARKLAADDGVDLVDHAARRQVLREDPDLRPQGAAVAPDPGPGGRALRRERGRSRLQHREPPAPGPLQRAAHQRQVLSAARRQGRGDHLLDGRGRGPDGAGAAAGQGRGPDRAPALRHRAGPHRHHQQGDRRGHGHLHADPHGGEDADPGRGSGRRPAPPRLASRHRHLLDLRLHRQGPPGRRDVPGVLGRRPTSSR